MMPSVVRKFTQLGFDVAVQSGAGTEAFADDATYTSCSPPEWFYS